jgi:hypothetical protein
MNKTNHILYNLRLPDEVITNILTFDQYIVRDKRLLKINKLDLKNKKYNILFTRPLIFIGLTNKYTSKPNNSITIYNNILEKTILEQYDDIHRSIRILKHF